MAPSAQATSVVVASQRRLPKIEESHGRWGPHRSDLMEGGLSWASIARWAYGAEELVSQNRPK